MKHQSTFLKFRSYLFISVYAFFIVNKSDEILKPSGVLGLLHGSPALWRFMHVIEAQVPLTV